MHPWRTRSDSPSRRQAENFLISTSTPGCARAQVFDCPDALPILSPPPARAAGERRKGAYALPPLTLLDPPKDQRKIDERQLMDAAKLLEEKCREFNVEGSVVQIHPGPVVTTYEFKPDAGVKYSRITGLADDLCLAMQAESVLIDRIPGKSTVGIQIPNARRDAISLRELLESETVTRSGSRLTMALGKTILDQSFELSAEQVFGQGAQAQGICYTSTEHRESVLAFLAKTAPKE